MAINRSNLWRRTVALPPDLATDLLTDIESYWETVLVVMENHAKNRNARPLQDKLRN